MNANTSSSGGNQSNAPEQCLKPVDELLGGVPSREIQFLESS